MILAIHLLVGAALFVKIQHPPLALFLSLLSHYFLDLFPPFEYSVENIRGKKWEKSLPDFLKVGLDILFGISIISILSHNQPGLFAAAFLAILPDGFTLLSLIFPNKFLKAHDNFHRKIQYFEYKKVPIFWGILGQATIGALAIFGLVC